MTARRLRVAFAFWSARRGVCSHLLMTAGLIVVAAGCAGKDGKAGDTLVVTADTTPASTDSGAVASDTGCVQAGPWNECNLTSRLESAGLAPRRLQGAIRQPFLSVPGFVYNVGNAEVQTYLYADTLALQRDFAQLDTVRVAPPTMQISWRATPNLIRSNNLLAILLSNDELQVERVRNAITAGLPALKTTP